MSRILTPLLALLFLVMPALLPAVQPVAAQNQTKQRADAGDTTGEYDALVSAMRVVVSILHDAMTRHAAEPISDQLRGVSLKLNDAAPSTGGFRGPSRNPDELLRILKDVRSQLFDMAQQTSDRDLSIKLYDMVDALDEAVALAENREVHYVERPSGEYYSEGTWVDGRRTGGTTGDRYRDRDKDRDDEGNWRRGDYNWNPDWDWDWNWDRDWSHGRISSSGFIGESASHWPYADRSLYRFTPAIRYNRVEGLVLGIAQDPLSWTTRDRGRIYGQVSYAFGLDDIRYEVGAETRIGQREDVVDVKFGGAYHQNTGTEDLWKSNWVENSLASALFKTDFFDYHETEGWTLYSVMRVTPYVQLSAGYRSDAWRSLSRNVSWSLFGGDGFRVNPGVVEGDMRSLVLSLEGGKVVSLNRHPKGVVFRAEAEIGQGLGGDFDFSRYVGDVRGYARLSRVSGFSLRMRGGFTEGDVPVQKAFTLGGAGTMRAYPQNIYRGTRMLLANAELALHEPDVLDWLLDDMILLGLFDAGWTNSFGSDAFAWDDVVPSAGLGLALDDRNLRFELAWPLRDLGTGRNPTFWLRLNPTF
jgi:hypothetical protein